MNSKEKQIKYESSNSYSTLNKLTEDTKHIWLVFHGMGYLSRYFIREFEEFDAKDHYFIAPQAPSKYYQSKDFRRVGASWLTKENTVVETENVLTYVNAIYKAEIKPILEKHNHVKFHVLGFSQGVSIASRFVAKYNISCDNLVLHSGGIPKELEPLDFKTFKGKAWLLYGNEDEWLTDEKLEYEKGRALILFSERLTTLEFQGAHKLNTEVLNKIIFNTTA